MTDALPTATDLLTSLEAWLRGETSREAATDPLVRLSPEGGAAVQELIALLSARAGAGPSGTSTDAWRDELMACRARTWRVPDVAGLLVGPQVLILTDGRAGVVLRDEGVRALTASVCPSMLLLCETIVMAQTALDRQGIEQLQRQRAQAASTSLSEIEKIS